MDQIYNSMSVPGSSPHSLRSFYCFAIFTNDIDRSIDKYIFSLIN